MMLHLRLSLLLVLTYFSSCLAYTGTASLTQRGPVLTLTDQQTTYRIELQGIDTSVLSTISEDLKFVVTDDHNSKQIFQVQSDQSKNPSIKPNALVYKGEWSERDESFLPTELRRSVPDHIKHNKQSTNQPIKQSNNQPSTSSHTKSKTPTKSAFGSKRSASTVPSGSPLTGYPEGVQPLLTLVMIVKNEAAGLQQTLDSTYGHIDHYSIVDTGSTDETIDIINRFYARLPDTVTHVLHHEEFVDFSTTRNRALYLAGNSTEFVLMMNGDDRLVGGEEMREFLETRRGLDALDESIYIIPIDYGGRASGRSERLARTRNHFVPNWPNDDYNHWRFEGVTHEAYVCNAALYSGARIIYTDGDFGIYHDITNDTPENKHSRFLLDVELLKKDLEQHPDSLNMPRNMYYLAQSYYNLDDLDNARIWYERRVEVNYIRPTPKKEDNEKHRAYSILAWIAVKKGEPAEVVERYWKLAYDACPAAWAVYNLASHHLTHGNVERAQKLAEKTRKLLAKGSPVVCAGDDPAVHAKLPGLIASINKALSAADDS